VASAHVRTRASSGNDHWCGVLLEPRIDRKAGSTLAPHHLTRGRLIRLAVLVQEYRIQAPVEGDRSWSTMKGR
jgi:hypothetical protein